MGSAPAGLPDIKCATVQGTRTEHKNELLYSRFGINYAKLPARYRKVGRLAKQLCVVPICHWYKEYAVCAHAYVVMWQGSTVVRSKERQNAKQGEAGHAVPGEVNLARVCHEDIIGDAFWREHPEILGVQ